MKKRIRLVSVVALAAIAVVSAQQASETAQKLGSKESAKWTDTTKESATNDQQKAWLNQGKPMTVTGELVEISCYMQLGKTGEKHIDCGSKCIRSGQPAGILTAKKDLYLLM